MLRRVALALLACFLLAIALRRLPGGQAAVSHSKAGQEDLTFWVNHNGLSQIDVEGEVGFGDAARILMRRRANAAAMRALRDRFVFKDRDFAKLPADNSSRYVIAQGRVFNLVGRDGRVHRVFEREPGVVTRNVAGRDIVFDVRPLVRLKVSLPEAARVYITGADGLGYAPAGAISRYASEPAEQFFHARAGSFELDLPAGETVVEATRGLEYKLTRRTIDLRKPTAVSIPLIRWTAMARQGWYSSDAHIHANYTAEHHQVVTPDDVLTYTLAEDLNVPNMMVANSSGAFIHDEALFEAKAHRLSQPNYFIYWNEEMRSSAYGHMCLYGLSKLVEPFYTGFRGTKWEDDYPPNFSQAKATRDQGGAVTYAHPGYATSFEGFSAKELPVDLALGEIDALDVMSNNPEEIAMENWYRLLNCGFRLAISAGTDAFTNVQDHYTPGGHRTYVHLGGAFDYKAWIAGYKRGRSFATNGPMLHFTVNSREPGDEIELPGGAQRLSVHLKVDSQVPIDKVELIVNGKPQPYAKAITIDRSSWIAARATGPWHRLVINDGYAFAHTSPVYVKLGGKQIESKDDARFWVEWIDKLISRTEQRGRFSTPERKRETVELFQKARAIYARLAG